MIPTFLSGTVSVANFTIQHKKQSQLWCNRMILLVLLCGELSRSSLNDADFKREL